METFKAISEIGGAIGIIFAVGWLLNIIFGFTKKKNGNNENWLGKEISLLKDKLVEESFSTIKNHLHTVDETLKEHGSKIDNLSKEITALSVIIDERIPKKL